MQESDKAEAEYEAVMRRVIMEQLKRNWKKKKTFSGEMKMHTLMKARCKCLQSTLMNGTTYYTSLAL